MDIIKIVMTFKLLLVQHSLAQDSVQRIVEGPEDVTVIVGHTALLRCRVQFQHGPVTWTKRKFSLGSERTLRDYPRYSMIGSAAEGEYHLEIKDVQLTDEDTYQCQILAAAGNQPFQTSKIVKLTVLVPPSEPRFFNEQTTLTGREGHWLSAKCLVQGAKPAAQVEWSVTEDQSGSVVLKKFTEEIQQTDIQRGNLFDVESTIRFVAQSAEDSKYLVCSAKHQAINKAINAAVQIKIRSKPKVKLTLNSTEPLKERGRALLMCSLDTANGGAASQGVQYKWWHNGQEMPDETSAFLNVSNLNRSIHHESEYECRVSNDIGSGESKLKLEMQFAPFFKYPAQTEKVQENQSVTFMCGVESNPLPKQIKWTKLNHPNWRGHSGDNLTIEKVSYDDEGKYNCFVITENFAPISQVYTLHVKGAPRVKISNKLEAVEGETVEIVCKITGYPKASKDNVRWFKGGQLLNPSTNQRYGFGFDEPSEDELYSVLTISKVLSSDFDGYNCSAANEFGTKTEFARLVESNSFPTYAILSGTIVGCMVILMVAAGCVYVNRKHLCRSKLSTQGDEHSDVMVKVEALDGNGLPLHYFPDMYNSGPPDGVDLVYNNKDYVSVPQDNPDFDYLPPPYPSYHMPNSTFSNGSVVGNGCLQSQQNGHLVHVTYIDDVVHPRSVLHHLSASPHLVPGDNALSSPNGYAGYSPQLYHHFNVDASTNALYHPLTGYGDQPPYHPLGVHQLPLEPVQEVPTPDTADEHQQANNLGLPRCPSQISTHV